MPKGNPQHEAVIAAFAQKCRLRGERFIDLLNKPPRYVGTDGLKIVCSVTQNRRHYLGKGWHGVPTATGLRARYGHFDSVHIAQVRPGQDLDACHREVHKAIGPGWRFFKLGLKCPDGLILREGRLVAFEALGLDKDGGAGEWVMRGKRINYAAFDGVAFETFRRQ